MLLPEEVTIRIRTWQQQRSVITTQSLVRPETDFLVQNPPLYLHLTCTNKEGLEKAIKIIDDLMQKELPNLVDERRFRRREPEQTVERDEYGRVWL